MRHAWTCTAAAALWLGGCGQLSFLTRPREPAPAPPPAADGGQAEYLAHTAVKTETAPPAPGAVDVALEWSRKYADASEQLVAEQRAGRELREQNRQLTEQAAKCQAQLAQTHKELAEANETLMQLGRETQDWKKQAGLVETILQAQKTQIDAMKKVLLLLGAEAGPTGGSSGPKQAVSAAGDAAHATRHSDG
jgi:hypothetical protein